MGHRVDASKSGETSRANDSSRLQSFIGIKNGQYSCETGLRRTGEVTCIALRIGHS